MAAPVSDSISTPVRSAAFARTRILITPVAGSGSMATSAPVMAIGWQNGRSSGVRLMARRPATRAASSGLPFGVPSTSRAHASGVILISHSATASRSVTSFAPTSTIRAASSVIATSLLERPEHEHAALAARLHTVDAGRDHREAVRPHHTGEEVRAACARGRGVPAVLTAGDANPREDGLSLRSLDVGVEHCGDPGTQEVAPPRHLEQRRPNEGLKGHEYRDRVPGQPEIRLALDPAERLRHPRLHRDPGEPDLAPLEARARHA